MAKLHIIFSALLIIATQSQGFEFWNDLRVTWWPTSDLRYDAMPRNTVDAVRAGWDNVSTDCSNGGRFNGNRWTHASDNAVALLFDANGNVAGIQALMPHDELIVPNNTFRFGNVPMFQNDTINGRDFFMITTYFIEPSFICTPGLSKDNIGVDSQVYFQNGASPSELRIVPKTRAEAIATGWTINQCVPGMGWHNFYKVEEYADHDCKEVQPHCILFNEYDEMIGVCLNINGMATSTRFEHPSPAGVSAVLGPVAPPCVVEETENAGTTTMHIYFTNTPWTQGCEK